MRQRAFDRRRYAIAADHGLRFDIQNRIGAEPGWKIHQAASYLVRIVPEIQRAARRRNAAFDNRILNWSIQLQRNRSNQVTEVVAHDECVAAFDSQLVEPGGFSESELAAFFDRGRRALVN